MNVCLAVKVHSQEECDQAQKIATAYGFPPSPYEWATYKQQRNGGICYVWVQSSYIDQKVSFPYQFASYGSDNNREIALADLIYTLNQQVGAQAANQELLAKATRQTTTQETATMALKKVSIVRRTVTKDNKVNDKIIHTSEPISNASDNGMLIATAAAVAPSLKDIPADELFAFVETLPEAK